MNPKHKTIKVGVLTVSDTRTPSNSDTETFDSSGHELKELINRFNVIESATVVEYDCVTDDLEKIQEKMIEWCSERKVDVLLSTGGTGFSPRDVTPEATLGIVQKLTPGISQAIMNESLKITPMAMLSRAISGIYKKTLIINLPGSVKAAKECLLVVASAIPHAVTLIKDEKEISKQFHDQFNSKKDIQSKVPECVTKVACRHRESPYPKISMASALTIIKEQAVIQYTKNYKIMYPTVWIYSTGDELENNKNPCHNCIRDTNSLMIKQLLEQDNYKGSVFNGGVIRDNWNDLCKQFEEAFNNADIIVTSGGVSMGEKDLIKLVLQEHFKCYIHFGRVNMKPGMPSTFVTLNYKDKKKCIFCLPGNPVSAGVCTHLFLLPYLRLISGRKSIVHSFKAKLTHCINELDVRPEFKRALFKYENGEFYVSCLTNNQQSSRLLSFLGANCLLTLPSSKKQTSIKAGTIMDIILIKSIENTDVSALLFSRDLQVKNLRVRPEDKCKPDNTVCLSLKETLDFMTQKNEFILKSENIPTSSAMGYVIDAPVYSSENLPPYPASIKDGYAIKYVCDGSWSQKNNIFEVVQVSVAGTEPGCQEKISEKKCARISTGAPIPPGANCVVQVEDTSVISKSPDETIELTIDILKEPQLHENIRFIGSDISVGQCLLDEKCQLGPFEIALLRSVGCESVSVYKYPTIHILPYFSNLACGISIILENILKQDGFKGKIICHSFFKSSNELLELYRNVFEHRDIIIIINYDYDNFNFSPSFDIEKHLSIKSTFHNIISLEFGIIKLELEKKRNVFFNLGMDSNLVYNYAHLFILPFLRFSVGKKQQISSVITKSSIDLPISVYRYMGAKLDYKDGDLIVTGFGLKDENCIVLNQASQAKDFNTIDTTAKLNVVITENSDSYFIHY